MISGLEFRLNTATSTEIAEHLTDCDADFIPPLSSRIEITGYAEKIANKATRCEAWIGSALVGMVAAYCNDNDERVAFITSVSVLRSWIGKGIGERLLKDCIQQAKAADMRKVCLEVSRENVPAIRLYEKCGFVAGRGQESFVKMCLHLISGDEHG